MQQQRQRAPWQMPTEQEEIEDLTSQLPSIESSITGGSLLEHESIEGPDQKKRCSICGKPWPCGGW
jgi:hypothetical protein